MLEKPRQALFSILGQDVTEDRPVLDCFAGTGVLGFEALSRGASHATFVDIEASHVKAINDLAAHLGCSDRCTVLRSDTLKFLTPDSVLRTPDSSKMRLLFVDPPHALVKERGREFFEWFAALADASFAGDDTLVVYGHHESDESAEQVGRWRRFDRRDYGNVAISLYQRA